MKEYETFDPDVEWLDLVQPVGLVVARSLLKELGLLAEPQTRADSAVVADLLNENSDGPVLNDPYAFVSNVLRWPARHIAGCPGGPDLPDELSVSLPEHETVLTPTWAVEELSDKNDWQLLVRIEEAGIDLDKRGALDGWEATPHQRFERLLRETGVCAGLMFSDDEVRLVYAPRGETSGWLSFPLRPLATVAGRPMLAGLKLILNSHRLFTDAPDRRLPALLRASREAQAQVSIELSKQVLGALHELLRGLIAAEPELTGKLAAKRPDHLYEGLLTVLMRLVFILFAEDRDLLPSLTEPQARGIYEQGYSVRGLFAKLMDDKALNPDTMDERVGGWGRLLALFRLVHGGHHSGWIRARGGKLFDPDEFPFLEGRKIREDEPCVLGVSDGCLLRLLRGLMMLGGERLSYRTLDVEQIGSVYETVMGFTVEQASGPSLAIKGGKNNKLPVFINLEELSGKSGKDRIKMLKDEADRTLTAKQQKLVKEAVGVDGMAAALGSIVDERGSPRQRIVSLGTPIMQPTDERRRTGSHYTPRSLTEPIVRHALEPAFERLGPEATPEQVLDLKVCDPACGSGAFLVEACRAISQQLVKAWECWPQARPDIPADEDEELHARRLVAQRCLYGVDKNSMATDLARLSLWLATLARDHEFTFLDHALKSGDSLVGLTNSQIAVANWQTGKGGMALLGRLVKERTQKALECRREIRNAPDNTTRDIQEEREKVVQRRLSHVRTVGDAVIAAFFAADKKKAREEERVKVEEKLTAEPSAQNWHALEAIARSLGHGDHPIRPFHWQLEFPEVFARDNPGFDAIIGNPPFAGKNTIAASYRPGIIDWLKGLHEGAHGNSDLVAYFFRRAFGLIRKDGVFGLIATNTIGQGDTRATGLTHILQRGGAITHAMRRRPWPGEAAVVVSVVHVKKGEASQPQLDGRTVSRISAYLVEGDLDVSPAPLKENAGKAFVGSYVLGMGFVFDDKAAAKGIASSLADMERLIEKDPKNRERIYPYIGGDKVNSDPNHRHHRYVIRLEELSLDQAEQEATDLIAIIRNLVKPEREKLTDNADGRRRKRFWWKWGRDTPALYNAITGMPRVLVRSLTSAHFSTFTFLPKEWIYDQTLIVWTTDRFAPLTVLCSSAHEVWGRFMGATLEDRGRYNIMDCFDNFPFPSSFEADQTLEAAGKAYHDHRAELMIARNEGMTKSYNRFHNVQEKSPDIDKLRALHAAMDDAVLRAYGWDDLADRAKAQFLDKINENEHKYQNRLFWPTTFRDEVLARLLTLNAERARKETEQAV